MRNYGKEILLAGTGIILVFTFAFGGSIFNGMIHHVASDLTDELGIHIYIAGWILLLYGIYRAARIKLKTKK